MKNSASSASDLRKVAETAIEKLASGTFVSPVDLLTYFSQKFPPLAERPRILSEYESRMLAEYLQARDWQTKYVGKRLACYFHWCGFTSIQLGFHVDLSSPNVEIHLPFCFIRFGWVKQYTSPYSAKE